MTKKYRDSRLKFYRKLSKLLRKYNVSYNDARDIINDLLATVPEKLKKEREPVGECSFCGDYIWDGIKHICEPPKKEEKKIEKLERPKLTDIKNIIIYRGNNDYVDGWIASEADISMAEIINQLIDLLNSHQLEIERLKERK